MPKEPPSASDAEPLEKDEQPQVSGSSELTLVAERACGGAAHGAESGLAPVPGAGPRVHVLGRAAQEHSEWTRFKDSEGCLVRPWPTTRRCYFVTAGRGLSTVFVAEELETHSEPIRRMPRMTADSGARRRTSRPATRLCVLGTRGGRHGGPGPVALPDRGRFSCHAAPRLARAGPVLGCTGLGQASDYATEWIASF